MIPDDFIQQLLSRVDVVEVIDRMVPLKKAGANYQACCPFHKEKTPSFSVSPTKQFYKCFGCGASGSAIKFLMEYAGKSFPDAVEDLAQGVGLTVPRDNERKIDPQAGPLFDVMIKAATYYKAQLRKSDLAKDYFKRRGVSGEVAQRFHLGWAPAGWQPLAEAFDDYADNQLLETGGLVKTGDGGKRYDGFRERVMFPILNQQGAVIGFGGRILGSKDDGGGPKYLNSPETPIFSKGRELYGLFQAQNTIRKINRVLVVEGYMDVVALAQFGIEYVVATLGTATTEAHTQRLLRIADEVVFSFDGDSAGQRAAWRALENALPALRDGKHVRFLFLPPEHDPDSYIREFGREAFEDFISKALPLSEYWLRELNARHPGDSAEAKAARASAARQHLEVVSAPMMRESLASALGRDVDMQSHTVLPPIKAKPVERNFDSGDVQTPRTKFVGRRPPIARTDPATQRVIANARRILGRPKLAMYLVDTQFPDPANAPHVLRLLQAVVNVAIRLPDEPNIGAVMEQFRESEFEGEISKLLTHRDAELDALMQDEEAESELRQLRAQIENGSLFHTGRAVAVPEHLPGMGILALGARRVVAPEAALVPLPTAPMESAFASRPRPTKTPPAAPSIRATPLRPAAAVAAVPVIAKTASAPPADDGFDDISFDFDAEFAPASNSADDPPF
ncbi:MAG: DNA primase [Betaproteobacteria bacterium]|nr:MAG: DNA primase [Betaproteobacteria bacterium]